MSWLSCSQLSLTEALRSVCLVVDMICVFAIRHLLLLLIIALQPELTKDALHNVIIAVGNISEMRSVMVSTHTTAGGVATGFQGIC